MSRVVVGYSIERRRGGDAPLLLKNVLMIVSPISVHNFPKHFALVSKFLTANLAKNIEKEHPVREPCICARTEHLRRGARSGGSPATNAWLVPACLRRASFLRQAAYLSRRLCSLF
jgi:hypothetical protein